MTVTATPPPATLGDLFRQRRNDQGKTLECVARDAGCALSTVIRIESGQRNPRRGTAQAIATALGVSAAELAEVHAP